MSKAKDTTVKVWPTGDQSAPADAEDAKAATDGSWSVPADVAEVLCESHGYTTRDPNASAAAEPKKGRK